MSKPEQVGQAPKTVFRTDHDWMELISERDRLAALNKELVEALRAYHALFDDEGFLNEQYQDQLSVADERAGALLARVSKEAKEEA